jgi:hypothetical protein
MAVAALAAAPEEGFAIGRIAHGLGLFIIRRPQKCHEPPDLILFQPAPAQAGMSLPLTPFAITR